MAWTAPPTFTSGAILQASQLNILSQDLEYLHGFITGANPAMTAVTLEVDGDVFGVVRHLHRYLRVLYQCNADIKLYYDATEVYHDGAPGGTPESHYVDLNSFGLTVGQLYTFKATMNSNDGQTRILFFAYETDTTA